jgi:hypothetical protein
MIMNLYGSKLLHWFLIDRWYFKNHIDDYSQGELITLWSNVKLVRENDLVRRDIGRLIANASERLINPL